MRKSVSFLLVMCWCLLSPTYAQKAVSIYTPKLTGELFIEKTYKGSEYVTQEWTNSRILLSTGDTIAGEKIKYDGYLDEIIWVHPKNFKRFKLDKPVIEEFWLMLNDSTTICYKKMEMPGTADNAQKTFLEIAHEGALSLYINRKIRQYGVVEETREGTSFQLEVLVPDNEYCFRLPSGEWITMRKLKMNNLLKYFPNQRKAIVQLANQNHLKFKTESQCIRLVRLIDEEILAVGK